MPIDKNLIETLMDLQKLTMGGGQNWSQELKGLAQMLQNLQGTTPGSWSWPSNIWSQTSLPPDIQRPHINIIEADKDVTITADLPGIKDSSDLAVRVKNDVLQIIGRSSGWAGEPGAPRTFSRTIKLPAEVESRGAQATYQNGTIVIRLSKKNRPYDHIDVKFV